MSKVQAKELPVLSNKLLSLLKDKLIQRTEGQSELKISLDLNLSEEYVMLDHSNQAIVLPSGERFIIPESFDPDENVCYFINNGSLYPIKAFSEQTNFYYVLVPTSFRPILRISATQMHKKPFLDFLERRKLRGYVLDAGTGLGYSAVIASQTADKLITVEWDTTVIDIASFNPHSAPIFKRSNVELIHADITRKIKEFPADIFDNIIHDGGMPKSSGDFFSFSHAQEVYRVLKPRGYLYFYLPMKGRSKGRDFGMEQISRLKKAGFSLVKRNIEESWAYLQK